MGAPLNHTHSQEINPTVEKSMLKPLFIHSLQQMANESAESAVPEGMAAFAKEVKRGQVVPGKYGNSKALPFLSYSLRSLIVYISEVAIVWDKVLAENQKAVLGADESSWEDQANFLGYIESVLDVGKCNDPEITETEACSKMLYPGCMCVCCVLLRIQGDGPWPPVTVT